MKTKMQDKPLKILCPAISSAKCWVITSGLLSLFLATPGFAQEESNDDTEVTTLAPRVNTNFYKSRSSSTVDKQKVERSSSPSSTLDHQPGVQLQETSRGGGTVFIRGLIGPENLLLIDGLRFNQSTFRTGPNQYLDTIGISGIEEIDAINGPAGLLFGSNAIGGVVNFKTNNSLALKNAAKGSIAFDSARGAVFGKLNSTILADKTTLRFGLNIGREGQLTAGEGPFLMASLNEKGDYLGSGLRRSGWFISLVNRPQKNVKLSAKYLGSQITNAPRLDRLGKGDVRAADNADHFGYLRGQVKGPKYFDDISVALMFHRTKETQRRFKCKKFGRQVNLLECARHNPQEILSTRENLDRVTTLGLVSSLTSIITPTINADLGIDLYRDEVSSEAQQTKKEITKTRRGNFSDGAAYSTAGIFALLSWTFLEFDQSLFEVQGGIRGDFVSASADNVPGLGDVSFTLFAPVASLNISYLSPTMSSWIGWHQGFRAPNLQETTLLGDTGNFFEIPNDKLNAERSNSFEIGSKFNFESIGEFGGSLFLNLVDNKITRAPARFEGKDSVDEKDVRKRVNEGDAYFYGLEARFDSKSVYDLSLSGNFSIVSGAVHSSSSDPDFSPGFLHEVLKRDGDYQHLRRLPPVSYQLALHYKRKNYGATFWTQGAGSQYELSKDDRKDLRICESAPGILSKDCKGTDAWNTINVKVDYQFEKLQLWLGAENLLNLQYRRHGSGVPGSGFGIIGGLSLSI